MPGIMDSPFKSISILYRKSHISSARLRAVRPDGGAGGGHPDSLRLRRLTQDKITKCLCLDKSVIAKTVTKLKELGFIVRTTNARDKRTFDIRPTEKAWGVYPHGTRLTPFSAA